MQRKIKRQMERKERWERPRQERRITLKTVAATVGTTAILTLITATQTLATPVGATVFDPTNYAKNLETAINSAQQVQNQYQQILTQARDFVCAPVDIQNQVTARYQNIINMQRYIDGLKTDFQTAMKVWDLNYPGFKSYNGMSAADYAKRSQTMLEYSDAKIKASYQTNALVASNAPGRQENLRQLLAASRTSQGAMAVMQVQNQVGALQCEQLQDLITVARQSSDAQNGYYEKEIQDKARQKAQIEHEKYIEPPATKQNIGATSFPND
jgi:type IV secretion system protein TrbJ